MPAKRKLTMRHIRQMLRLAGSGTSSREIAVMLGIARSTVQDNLKRAAMAGLSWALASGLTDDVLEAKLFVHPGVKRSQRLRQEPDWGPLSIELKKPGVTLLILWEEYRSAHPDGYGYSRFCELFRGFEKRLSPTMRQEHIAGDKVFVDYSGKKVPIVDRKTGEIREAELFLGVLGASSYCTRGRSVILASCFASVDFPAPGQPTIMTRFISCPPFEALPAPLVGTTAIGQFNLQRVLAAFARQKQRSVLCQVGAGFDAERKHSRLISSPDSKLVQLVASERQADGYVEFTVADNDRIRFRNL